MVVPTEADIRINTKQEGDVKSFHKVNVQDVNREIFYRLDLFHTPIIIENRQLQNPIHAYGKISFKFDKKSEIVVLDDRIKISGSLGQDFTFIDYNKQTQYFIIFSYKSKYHVQVKKFLNLRVMGLISKNWR